MLAGMCFGEKLTFFSWCGTILAFGGILIMTLWDGSFHASQGIIWMLAAALSISSYSILQRGLSRRHDPLIITTYSFITGALLLLPFLPEAFSRIRQAPLEQVALVCFLGICPSAAAYLLWSKALAIASNTSAVTNYMFLTPFLTLLLEYFVTDQLPGPGTFLGGTVILAALMIFMASEKTRFDEEKK